LFLQTDCAYFLIYAPTPKQITTKTALIVEDSPTQAMHLHHLLSGHGLSVILAHDGEEGLNYAKTHFPNIIVLDIELPAMNGIELL